MIFELEREKTNFKNREVNHARKLRKRTRRGKKQKKRILSPKAIKFMTEYTHAQAHAENYRRERMAEFEYLAMAHFAEL